MMDKDLFNGPWVELSAMLAAREARVLRQKELLREGKRTLICLTMNLAGPVKRFALADALFEQVLTELRALPDVCGWTLLEEQVLRENTGCEAILAVDGAARAVKVRTAAIEERGGVWRLLDVDVLDSSGEKVCRKEVGLEPRRCFLCPQPAAQCGRSRRHTVEQLQAFSNKLLADWFLHNCSEQIGDAALRALLWEVSVTPKPGLVDRYNNGAHQDMDFYSFLNSAVALRPAFTACARIGLEMAQESAAALFAALQTEGIRAEQRMLVATKGVNTHKGAIFSLGLLSAAAGILAGQGQRWTVPALCRQAALLAREAVAESGPAHTGGQLAYLQYGLPGVRGEAAEGFPRVCQTALPVLRQRLAAGENLNDAAATALLHLLARTDDTNIVKRGGYQALGNLQRRAAALLEEDTPIAERAGVLDRALIQDWLSPGGCADLLAAALFLWSLTPEER